MTPDEQEVLRLKKALLRLGRWKDIQESGVWLVFITILYALLRIVGLSGITVSALFFLLQLTSTFLLTAFDEYAQSRKWLPEYITAEDFIDIIFQIMDEELVMVSNGLGIVTRNACRSYHSLLESDNSQDHFEFGVTVILLGLINFIIPLSVMIFFLGFSLFLFPVAYDKWHDPIEQRISQMYRTQSNFFNSLRSR